MNGDLQGEAPVAPAGRAGARVIGAAAVCVLVGLGCQGADSSGGGPISREDASQSEAPVLQDRSSWPVRELRDEPFDVFHYRVELDLDDATDSFTGNARVFLHAEERISEIALDAETFVVTEVTSGGRPLDFHHEDGVLRVELGTTLVPGDETTVDIAYEAENVDVDSTRFGMPASYDLGLDFKPETESNPRLVNTLSFPEGARHWYPSVDHPADRATFELLATAREDWRVLSNGALLEISDGPRPGTRTHHWRLSSTHPTYLSVLVAGPYEVIEDVHDDGVVELAVNSWVYEAAVPDAHRSFHKTAAMIAFFEEEFGTRYPWSKYSQITIPGIGGGAESTTATVLGQSTIHDERAEQDFPSHGLVAHEIAHHWWGNLVSYRDWGETWLSESFATYSEYLWHADELGPDEAGENMRRKRESYLRQARTVLRPVITNRWRRPNDNFDAHTYPKGAALIRLLRHVVGDETFRSAVENFLREHAYEPVDTEDFIDAFADARTYHGDQVGSDIRWFVDMWLRRPGHPILEVATEWADGELVLNLRQVQGPAASEGTVPEAYRAPLSLRVATDGGSELHEFWMEGREQQLRFPVAERPRWVRFDADDVLLAELRVAKPAEQWMAQALEDDGAGRRRAVVALGELETPDARAALRRAALDDPFWAVREAAAAGLDPASADELSVLRTAASEDPKSRVRATAVERMGAAAGAAFLINRFRADSSYVAQAAAMTALGEIGAEADDDAREALEEGARMASPRDVVARAARDALAAVGAR